MPAGNIFVITKTLLIIVKFFDIRKKGAILVAKIEYCDIAFFGPTLAMLSFMSLGRSKAQKEWESGHMGKYR